MNKLDRIIFWFTILVLGIMIGYAWRMVQIANAYEYIQPAGWVENDRIKAAMDNMGPRYSYMMVGESQLYVDTGSGWQRLRF